MSKVLLENDKKNEDMEAVFKIDEKVVVHEMILENLVRRQLDIRRKRLDIKTKLDDHKERLATLFEQRQTLSKAKQKHEGLKIELEKQIGAHSISEDDDAILSVCSGDQSTTEDQQETRCDTDTDNDNNNNNNNNLSNNNNNDNDNATTIHRNTETSWIGQYHSVSIPQNQSTLQQKPFFPFVRSEHLLIRILYAIRLQIIEFDKLPLPESSQRRRQALMLGTGLQINEFQEDSNTAASSSSSSSSSEQATIIPLTTNSSDVEPSISAMEANKDTKIDADAIICPYELAGECCDPYCNFQHLLPRQVQSQLLVKETLVLPRLKLPKPPMSLQSLLSDEEEENAHSAHVNTDEAPSPKRARVDTDLPSKQPVVKKEDEESTLSWDDDFVAVPYVRNDQDETDDTAFFPWWMRDTQQERISNLPDNVLLSFDDFLEVYYGENLDHNIGQNPPLTLLGELLGATTFCFIAGRLDRAHSIHELLLRACSQCNFDAAWTLAFKSIYKEFTEAAVQTGLPAISSLTIVLIKMELLSYLLRMCHEIHVPVKWATLCLSHIIQPFDEKLPNIPTDMAESSSIAVSPFLDHLNEFRKAKTPFEENQSVISEVYIMRKEAESEGFGFRLAFLISRIVATLTIPNAQSGTNLPKYGIALSLLIEDFEETPLIVPSLALRVLLHLHDRRYDKAQKCLLDWFKSNRSHHPRYSSFLWSQLIQLRAYLPSSDDDDNDSLVSYSIGQLGIWCNHFMLWGDQFLLSDDHEKKQLLRANALRLCQTRKKSEGPMIDIDLQGCCVVAEEPVPASFPFSILVLGVNTLSLQLDRCKLGSSVPDSFGKLFPHLKELSLSWNNLRLLPSTIGEMQELKHLVVSQNLLEELPTSIGSCRSLQKLDASFNTLSKLPFTIVQCQKLQVLDISSNRFLTEPNIAFRMSSLISLELSNNPLTETLR